MEAGRLGAGTGPHELAKGKASLGLGAIMAHAWDYGVNGHGRAFSCSILKNRNSIRR